MKIVYIENGRPVTDSLAIAEAFGKSHDNVLRDIRSLECSQEFSLLNFEESTYTNDRGRTYPKYLITQDGFAFLVTGYTGKEAARFKEMYINEFNRMKGELSTPQFQLPQTMPEALRLLASQIEETEVVRAEKLALVQKIEVDKPKVLFADSLTVSQDTINVNDLAKLLRQNGVQIGERRLFIWLRENGYLIKSGSEYNMPTQRSMDLKLFEVKMTTRQGSDGTPRMQRTPKVTGRGQMYFMNKLKPHETA